MFPACAPPGVVLMVTLVPALSEAWSVPTFATALLAVVVKRLGLPPL